MGNRYRRLHFNRTQTGRKKPDLSSSQPVGAKISPTRDFITKAALLSTNASSVNELGFKAFKLFKPFNTFGTTGTFGTIGTNELLAGTDPNGATVGGINFGSE
jgi:hypothetical protein